MAVTPSCIRLKMINVFKALVLCVAVGSPLSGCSEDHEGPPPAGATGEEPACAPSCAGRACGEDGCGGVCGVCGEGESCTAAGACAAAEPPGCAETCEGKGWSCGEVCGVSCGSCDGELSRCEEGACVCAPSCAGKVCGEEDGCGGTCAPCPVDVSCATCPLVLQVVEREEVGGRLQSVTLALDYQAAEGGAAPTIADLRVKVSGPARLERVGLGEAMLSAGKELTLSPSTGRPYQELPGGVFQFLALSSESSEPIGGGRWLFLRFLIGDTASEGPATFALVKREQVLAPPSADSALWSAPYDAQVVIWPEVRHAQ